MSLLQELEKSKCLLVFLKEKMYLDIVSDVIESVKDKKKNICFVCLTRPYQDVVQDLKDRKIDTKNLFFVDTMSSHYVRQSDTKNCVFVESPNDLNGIKNAISNLVIKKNVQMIVFDTISALLEYQQEHDILHFTNELIKEKNYELCKKLFLFSRENNVPVDQSALFAKDLELFTDSSIDLTKLLKQ